jgi:hypothetical protein
LKKEDKMGLKYVDDVVMNSQKWVVSCMYVRRKPFTGSLKYVISHTALGLNVRCGGCEGKDTVGRLL